MTRQIAWSELQQVSLSPRQDDLLVLHVTGSFDSVLLVPFKTELVTVAKRLYKEKAGGAKDLKIAFLNK